MGANGRILADSGRISLRALGELTLQWQLPHFLKGVFPLPAPYKASSVLGGAVAPILSSLIRRLVPRALPPLPMMVGLALAQAHNIREKRLCVPCPHPVQGRPQPEQRPMEKRYYQNHIPGLS